MNIVRRKGKKKFAQSEQVIAPLYSFAQWDLVFNTDIFVQFFFIISSEQSNQTFPSKPLKCDNSKKYLQR